MNLKRSSQSIPPKSSQEENPGMLKHKSSVIHISQLSELSSARSQSALPYKSTHISKHQNDENFPQSQSQSQSGHQRTRNLSSFGSRTRTTSTSSVKTVKEAKEKKRPRESEGDNQERRNRQRTVSDSYLIEPKSTVPFPSSTAESTTSKPSKKALPPTMLMATRAAPAVPVVTSSSKSQSRPQTPNQNESQLPTRMAASFSPNYFHPFPPHFSTPTDPIPEATSWQDQWGNIHLGASELDLSISFYKRQPYFDVWDLDDDVYIGIPARVHVKPKASSRSHLHGPLAPEPDLRYVDICCTSGASDFYCVKYEGFENKLDGDLSQAKGILLTKKWFKRPPPKKYELLITSLKTPLPSDSVENASVVDGDGEDEKTRGWYIKVLIPVLMGTIRAGNARAFRIDVRVAIGAENDVIYASKDMVVSHLQTEAEMALGKVLGSIN